VLKTMPDEIGISVTYPLPGTKLFEDVKSQLSEKTNWTDSDEMAMMFQSTYPKPFYKELQRYMHTLYRRERSFLAIKNLVKSPFGTNYKQLKAAFSSLFHSPYALYRKRKLNSYKPL